MDGLIAGLPTVVTEPTVRKKFELEVKIPSVTLKVMVAVPVNPVAGVIATVRLVPLPPNMILAEGTSVVLDDVAETARMEVLSSASPTVKGIAAVAVFTVVV